ncbi:MAG: DNA-directed RNA polymerase subunit beta' [Candidatus Nomurabacteria bacterium]|nr:DNA-directed RNA polymerase subunit beta' [Candidatus Nomurabacteria bacterium]
MKNSKTFDTQYDVFDSIRLSIASPEQIREWSYGEILKPETINYRTGRSERQGLFDEKIFGPEKDYECYCKKYRGVKYKGIVCEKCGVELTRSVVRRERMGHIELASPVVNIWYLRAVPSKLSSLLNTPITALEKVIYFAGYIITSVDLNEKKRILKEIETEYKNKLNSLKTDEDKEKLKELFTKTKKDAQSLSNGTILDEVDYHKFSIKFGAIFEAGIGAEAIVKIVEKIDLKKLIAELEEKIQTATAVEKKKMQKRLSLARGMLHAGIRPEWMFMQAIPVIPPALRPMVALDGGRHATSDLNDLYRRVINRNNRLKKLLAIGAPDVILRNEKRILQEAVDALIDNSIRKAGGPAMSQAQRRQLKSLSDNLKSKQGLFRQNLLGKRVDYSGRSVIVIGATLKLDQCGLPKTMALELFRPFVISGLIERELAYNIRGAGKLIEDNVPEVWEILEEVIADKHVLLNRAPTLHRLSIQAFRPILIEGKAIQLHPMVCAAFNADFDGDQMAVHVPLSHEAQREARELISSAKNLLKSQDGRPTVSPAQDIVLGCYWMTKTTDGEKGEGKVFANTNEAILSYDFGKVSLRASIKVVPGEHDKYAQFEGKPFDTTVGRLLFNSVLPNDFPFINQEMTKKRLSSLIEDIIAHYGVEATPEILDKIKTFGFKYVTISGSTFGMDDVRIPKQKPALVAEGRKKQVEIESQYQEGLLSTEERHQKVIEIWNGVKSEITELIPETLDTQGSVFNMVYSGARGSIGQMTQMAGMKGLIVNTVGREIDFPIIPSYKEGLSAIEYFVTTHGARKGLTDVALNTARAGYLTRKMIDVAQDVMISEDDCQTKNGLTVSSVDFSGVIVPLADQIYGRVIHSTVKDSEGNILAKKNDTIDRILAKKIEDAGVETVEVRSPLKCETTHGVCQRCYGVELGRRESVKLGDAVGIIAAQSLGEPGTQLTLRSFHSGGVAGLDITTGLPRVEEVFERRIPKVQAAIAKANGLVTNIFEEDGEKHIEIDSKAVGKTKKDKKVIYSVDRRLDVFAKVGDEVVSGQILTDGSADIDVLSKFGGQAVAQEYIVTEVQRVYEHHSASVNRKHIEIIARQMFSRVKIEEVGDTDFSPGDVVERIVFIQENKEIEKNNGILATANAIVLGIIDVSLSAKSWLSSASFQHTTRTLVANAVKGGVDELRGLKENVIIGNLIPAGTGLNDDYVADLHPEKEDYERPE